MTLFASDPLTRLPGRARRAAEAHVQPDAVSTIRSAPASDAGAWRRGYFGTADADSRSMWAEIQFTGWMIDGGVLMIGALRRRAHRHRDGAVPRRHAARSQPRLAICGGGHPGGQPGHRRDDLQLHAVRGAGRHPVLVPGRRAARRRAAATGSRAHDALARRHRRLHAARRHGPRQPRAGVVIWRAGGTRRRISSRTASAPDSRPRRRVTRAPASRRPLGAHLLGAPLLARPAARRRASCRPRARVLMNGGNGAIGDADVDPLPARGLRPQTSRHRRTRISASAGRRYYLRREARGARGVRRSSSATASAPRPTCTRCYGVRRGAHARRLLRHRRARSRR